ncbi:MAG: cytochrome c3 family protein [Planctomycetes bacterium]|nr:cytochrome c3 family protein [Planctomycetota bacterium]
MDKSVALFFIVALFFLGGSLLFTSEAQPAITQPFDFNHAAHSEKTNCWDCHFICEKNRDDDGDVDCEDCIDSEGPFCEEHLKCADHKLPGMPQTQDCLRCHEYDLLDLLQKDEGEELQPNEQAQMVMLDFVEFDEYDEVQKILPLEWNRVSQIKTSCIYFSHRSHALVDGLACDECHGDVAAMKSPPTKPKQDISMQWCLDCHQERDISTDCLSCHR